MGDPDIWNRINSDDSKVEKNLEAYQITANKNYIGYAQ